MQKKTKIDKSLRNKWIKALKSGRYKQGTSALCHIDKDENGKVSRTYCCLGVLCQITRIKMVKSNFNYDPTYFFNTEFDSKSTISPELRKKLDYLARRHIGLCI